MSKTRTNSPIADVDRIAEEEGIKSLEKTGEKSRSFQAFGRVFEIEEAPAGKVGIYAVKSTPVDMPDDAAYGGMETHITIRRLFRRAVKWKERVP
ncbi:MAG: hypothetical protein ACRDPE_09290 [Solirubrobacterales bacterium]